MIERGRRYALPIDTRSKWRVHSKDELIAEIERKLHQRVPEAAFGFSQPIESRIKLLALASDSRSGR